MLDSGLYIFEQKHRNPKQKEVKQNTHTNTLS